MLWVAVPVIILGVVSVFIPRANVCHVVLTQVVVITLAQILVINQSRLIAVKGCPIGGGLLQNNSVPKFPVLLLVIVGIVVNDSNIFDVRVVAVPRCKGLNTAVLRECQPEDVHSDNR